MLAYLKIMEGKLINMLSTATAVRKIDNANKKGYKRKIYKEKIK